MSVAVGDLAPDFTLPGTDGTVEGRRDYTLSTHRGHVVVLVFYPGDNTLVCTRQLNTYTADIDAFDAVEAKILALSPQSVESHERFISDQGGFAFPLLADGDKAVGRKYGVVGPVGFYRRSVFVVDPEGIIRYRHRGVAGINFRPTVQLVEAVRQLSPQPSDRSRLSTYAAAVAATFRTHVRYGYRPWAVPVRLRDHRVASARFRTP